MTDPTHIGQLRPDPRNARRHTPRNVGMIETSLREVGAARSIVIDEHDTIMAGNATIEAAAAAGIERVRVVEADGNEIIAVRRRGMTDVQKTRLGLFDNWAAALAEWEGPMLAVLAENPENTKNIFRPEELAAIIASANQTSDLDQMADGHGDPIADAEADRDDGADIAQGELLALVDVTIAEPRHHVVRGERWRVGPHLLVCATVSEDHALWAPDLVGDVLFCPYPGPFVPLTLRAEERTLLMVQPNPYIAGHLLDRYTEVKGEGAVSRA